jgi:hypothetical protein
MIMTSVPGVVLADGAPGGGGVVVPQPASTAEVTSATIVVIVRHPVRRVGGPGALVMGG